MVLITTCSECKAKVVTYSDQFNICKKCGNKFFSEKPKISWNTQNYELAKKKILSNIARKIEG